MAPPKVFLFSPSEVAEVVGADPKTVRRWCNERRVFARQTPGAEWRIECDEQGWPYEPGQVHPHTGKTRDGK